MKGTCEIEGDFKPAPGKRRAAIIVNEDDPDACWGWRGRTDEHGYARFHVAGRRVVKAHRLAYEDFVGPIPEGQTIDHRCHTKHCCNPDHLRLATNKQQRENPDGLQRNNTSGIRGVCWDKRRGKWMAKVGHNGRKYWLGYFDTIEEAEAAAIAKRNELFTHNDADR